MKPTIVSLSMQQHIISLLQQCKFEELCNAYFSDNFQWGIKGSSILSGVYFGKKQLFDSVLNRLSAIMAPGWRMHILHTYVIQNTFIIEMKGEARALNGESYNNDYCWIFTFKDKKIIRITAYYDSLLVNKVLIENEI